MTKLKKGDRVVDRFKVPKEGDECTTGTVLKRVKDAVEVHWDDGSTSYVAEPLLERIRGE